MTSSPHIKIFSISELTRRIRATLEEEIGAVYVEGEISNFRQYASGHRYFILKDKDAQLSAVLFAGAWAKLPAGLTLQDGQQIRVFGSITVYPERGQYQLIVRTVEAVGAGDLMQQFEQLKQRLQSEGLFDAARKRPLPLLPQRIGLVTSPSGAVIHDMITVLGRRFPNLQFRLVPVKVQGADAARDIAQAIDLLNRICGAGSGWPADVLIVGRGGGSLEDLWAFNEEPVVRAVAASRIPVLSAVGHETDYTLCDFAADVRAPTPSAAAEMVIAPKADFEARLMRHAQMLSRCLLRAGEQQIQRIDSLDLRLRHAGLRRLQQIRTRLERATNRIIPLRERHLRTLEMRLNLYRQTLERTIRLQMERNRSRIHAVSQKLHLLDPFSVLDRGYTLTRTDAGRLVRSVADVREGAFLLTQTKDGTIRSHVEAAP